MLIDGSMENKASHRTSLVPASALSVSRSVLHGTKEVSFVELVSEVRETGYEITIREFVLKYSCSVFIRRLFERTLILHYDKSI